MKIASVAEIKSKFSEYIKESQKGAVVITKNGRPTAVLLSVSDDDQLEQIIFSQSKMLKNILDKSEKNILSNRKIKHKDFWEELDKNK
jgi:prevent-host-death family protein